MNFSVNSIELPITIVPAEPLDDDELMRFCAENDLLRIERTSRGELRVMSPAGGGTGASNAEIIVELGVWTRRDGRGIAFDSNTGFTLRDGAMFSPDAAWILRSRWLGLSEGERARFAPICPDFVIELRSRTDNLAGLKTKMEQWIANGAEIGWMIDPSSRSVTIYRRGEEPETLLDPTSAQGTGPVLGFELVMSWVWGEDRPGA